MSLLMTLLAYEELRLWFLKGALIEDVIDVGEPCKEFCANVMGPLGWDWLAVGTCTDKPTSDFFLRKRDMGLSRDVVESLCVCIPRRLALCTSTTDGCGGLGGSGGTGGISSGESSENAGLVGDIG